MTEPEDQNLINYDPDVDHPEMSHPDITIGAPPATIAEETFAPVHPDADTLKVTAHTAIVKES